MVNLSDPCDPYMTFENQAGNPFVATDPLVILTKFGKNRIKHVAEETNCVKARRKKSHKKKNIKKKINK